MDIPHQVQKENSNFDIVFDRSCILAILDKSAGHSSCAGERKDVG